MNMNNDQSYVQTHNGATSYNGRDGVELFRIAVLASALGLYGKTGMQANRAYTLTNMLRNASTITGKTYKKTRAGALAAQADLNITRDTLKAALPHLNPEGQPV